MNNNRFRGGPGPSGGALVPAGYNPNPPAGQPAGVLPGELRLMLGQIERKMNDALGAVKSRLGEMDARIEDAVRVQTNQNLSGPGTGVGVVPGISPDIANALVKGLCRPFFSIIDIFVPAGETGEFVGAMRTDSTGPFAITDILGFARISEGDQNGASQWPYSLIEQPPSNCNPDAFAQSLQAFQADPCALIPKFDLRGCFVPVGGEHQEYGAAGIDTVCYKSRDATGEVTNFAAKVPILFPKYPEVLDGLVEIFTNSCAWQFAPTPVGLFSPQSYGVFNITDSAPGPFGVCGLLDCSQDVTVQFTASCKHRFDLVFSLVLAGFRLINCSTGSCGSGV